MNGKKSVPFADGIWNPLKKNLEPRVKRLPGCWKRARRIYLRADIDLFHPDVETEVINAIFEVMEETPKVTFLVDTTFPGELCKFADGWFHGRVSAPNISLGVRAFNQEMLDQAVADLIMTEAASRWLHLSPLQGPIEIPKQLRGWRETIHPVERRTSSMAPLIGWVVAGGGVDPIHPNWIRCIRDQCREAGIPFFFEGWGEWLPMEWIDSAKRLQQDPRRAIDEADPKEDKSGVVRQSGSGDGTVLNTEIGLFRLGGERTGCLLDGREWKAFPA